MAGRVLAALVVFALVLARAGAAGPGGAPVGARGRAAVWGEDGHRIVGWIAFRHLDATARAEVTRLLEIEGTSLPEAAYWPDAVARRLEEYRYANQLHYANVPRGEETYEPERDRPEGGDVVSGIERFAAVLADRAGGRTDAERLEALRFLAHFVGDIHQPLHVGYLEDRGGNDTHVVFYQVRSRLHAVWDTGILSRATTDWEGYAARLDAMLRPGDVEAYTAQMAPLAWAREAHRLAVGEVYGRVEPEETVGAAYVEDVLPVVDEQLLTAGVRLAAMLNGLLGEGEAVAPPAAQVYVSRSGRVYHGAACRYARAAVRALSEGQARAEGLEACEVCRPGGG